MMPILFRFGSLTVYSFGLMLAVAVLVGTFLIWQQARKQGLSEEKILDILFLTVMLALIFGRASFVYDHWSLFAADWSRIFLVGKYPGISFITSLVSGLAVSGLLAKNSNLSVFLVWDIFSLAMSLAVGFGLFGCALDNCISGAPVHVSLILALLGLIWWLVLTFLAKTLSRSPALVEIARKPGLLLLGYLIFQVISLLMLESTTFGGMRVIVYGVVLVALLVFLVGRYWQLFKHLYGSISQKRSHTDS